MRPKKRDWSASIVSMRPPNSPHVSRPRLEFTIERPRHLPTMLNKTLSLLVVENDQRLRTPISTYLREQSFLVAAASNGREMERCLSDRSLDLIVLGLPLPGDDGFSPYRRIPNDPALPVVVLTARNEDIDRIIALEMGADDCLSKPFSPRELLARINAILRRQTDCARVSALNATRLGFQNWIIDLRARELRDPDGRAVLLTSAEFDLLQAFCTRPGRILSRDGLLSMTRARPGGPLTRGIDVLVNRLRGKLDRIGGTTMIKTVRSAGYIFTPDVTAM